MKSLVATVTLIVLTLTGVLIYMKSLVPLEIINSIEVSEIVEDVATTTEDVATTTATTTKEEN